MEPIDFKNGEEVQEFSLDEVSGRKLHKHFDLFYRNRLSSEAIRKNEEKS